MADILVNNPNWQSFASGLEQDRGLQPGLLRAVAMNETGGGNPNIINQPSSAGAQGMFQFMPGTAADHNVNVNDPADSTRGAADYLSDLTKKFGDPLLAGAAYNWGPGNVAQAQAAAAKAGLPTDAQSLASNGFLTKETANYVGKLASQLGAPQGQQSQSQQQAGAQIQPFSPDVINSTRQAVVQMTMQGASPVSIVNALAQSPVAPMIQHLTASGATAQDIVTQVGGAPLADMQAKQAAVGQQSFLTNLGQGASNAVGDLSAGAKQLGARISGNDALLQQLQAQQAAAQADPTRQAQGNTVGGMIGSGGVKALPYIVGTALAPEATIPMMAVNAGVGGAMGALQPTTGDGQILGNIGTEATLGALGAGAGSGVGRLASKAIGGNAAATARLADAQAQGLPASVSSISSPGSLWRNIADSMPENGSVTNFQNSADQAVAGKVAEGLGLQGYSGPIDTNMLDAARQPIKDALDSATNFNVALPSSLRNDMDTLIASNTNPLTEGIEQTGMVKTAASNLSKAADAGMNRPGF